MTRRIHRILVLLIAALLGACSELPTTAGGAGLARPGEPSFASVPLACPSGWSVQESGRGVLLCQKRWSSDVLAFVDLGRGARVMSLYEGLSAASARNPSPQFRRYQIGDWWGRLRLSPLRFCVFNGGFYQTHTATTELTFPFKLNGRVMTAGGRTSSLPGKVLSMDGGQAAIRTYNATSKDFARVSTLLPAAPHAIVGYSTSVGQGRETRTYLGVRDGNRDGRMETVMVYIAYGTLETAYGFLRGLGSPDVVQLDGGASSQYMCAKSYARTMRPIPHALAIYAAQN